MKKAVAVVAEGLTVTKNRPFDARGLSKRDSEFVHNVLSGMTKMEAMKMASAAIGIELTDGSAHTLASRALQKPQVDSAIVQALEAAGINDQLVAEKLKEGLDADGTTQAGIPFVDYKTRLGYINTILKVKGQIGPDSTQENKTINYVSFKDEADA